MIYLSSPYSHTERDTNNNKQLTRENRYLLTMYAFSILCREGHFVYSPIVSCHEAAKLFNLPTDFQFWLNFNHSFIDAAEEVWVLCLDHWTFSKGVREEIDYAKLKGKTVRYFALDPIHEAVIERTESFA